MDYDTIVRPSGGPGFSQTSWTRTVGPQQRSIQTIVESGTKDGTVVAGQIVSSGRPADAVDMFYRFTTEDGLGVTRFEIMPLSSQVGHWDNSLTLEMTEPGHYRELRNGEEFDGDFVCYPMLPHLSVGLREGRRTAVEIDLAVVVARQGTVVVKKLEDLSFSVWMSECKRRTIVEVDEQGQPLRLGDWVKDVVR